MKGFIKALERYSRYIHLRLSSTATDEVQEAYNRLTTEEQGYITKQYPNEIKDLFTPIHQKPYNKN